MKSRRFTVIALALVAVLIVTGAAACTRAKPARPAVSEAPTTGPNVQVPTTAPAAQPPAAGLITPTVGGPAVQTVEVILLPSPTTVPGMPTPTSPAEMPTPAVTLVIPLTPQIEILATPTPVLQIPAGKVGQVYVVKSGDTLFGIAVRFGATTEEIMRANNMTTDALSIGEQLVIPVPAGTAAQPETKPQQPSKPPAPVVVQPGPVVPKGARTHIVKPGENLFRIALNYNVSMDALALANNIVPPWYIIYPGQQLVIP